MKIPISYLLAAVLFGLIVAVGFASMTYHPLPVQVQINQYAPIKAPESSIPTHAPQLVVDNHKDTGKFDPAPAPVVVTTAPLPTITPEPTLSTLNCDVNATDSATSMVCVTQNMMGVWISIIPLLFLVCFIATVLRHLIDIPCTYRR